MTGIICAGWVAVLDDHDQVISDRKPATIVMEPTNNTLNVRFEPDMIDLAVNVASFGRTRVAFFDEQGAALCYLPPGPAALAGDTVHVRVRPAVQPSEET